jgi:hypothetical protein
MDVFLLLLFAAGVGYGFVRLLGYLIPRDRAEWQQREALNRRTRKVVNRAFEQLAEDLKKKPGE